MFELSIQGRTVNFDFIDAHAHVNSRVVSTDLIADPKRVRAVISMGVPLEFGDEKNPQEGLFPGLKQQTAIAIENARNFKNQFFAVGIDTSAIGTDPHWLDRTIASIEDTRRHRGFVGVKVWKPLGLKETDAHGNIVPVDHPHVVGLLKHLVKEQITLVWHYADPDWLWKSLDEMQVMIQHHWWCSNHPCDHMYGKAPDFETLFATFETLLSRKEFRDLKVSGAHMFNLGNDLPRLERIMNMLPNSAIDISARLLEWMWLVSVGKEKVVKRFVEKFQNRIMYGTDQFYNIGLDPKQRDAKYLEQLEADAQFLMTDDIVERPNMFRGQAKGLALSPSTIRQIFSENAIRFFGLKQRV